MKRIRDYGIIIGNGKTGKLNKITDVPGVRVGHYTLENEQHNTGITVILPCEDNPFINKVMATSHIINGYGKTLGLIQVEELGYIETPIALTNTLNVGKVHDSLVQYMIEEAKKENIEITSINPIVGECNDYPLNNIQDRVLNTDSVKNAILNAKIDFDEGDVGAGKGTICLGVKGGIGSASRLTLIDDKYYTIGVLVQSNFGGSKDLIINGKNVGDIVYKKTNEMETGKGSIMIIVATDLPVNERQLKRIIKRTDVGLSRVGSYIGHDSGDVVIGFSTANRITKNKDTHFNTLKVVDEDKLNYVFKMIAEATEEAVLNSLATAKTVTGFTGKTKQSLTNIYLKDYFNNLNLEAFIEGVPAVNQFPSYPVGCESVALYQLLKYYNVDVTIEDIVTRLKKGKAPHQKDNKLYGGNPEIEFVGDPKDYKSYGVYEKPIEDVANTFKSNIKNITGSSLEDILKLVKEGYPVQVWITINLSETYISTSWIHEESGKVINWQRNLHSVVITGYSKEYIVVADPYVGATMIYNRKIFEDRYNCLGKRALYYEEKLEK